MIEVTYSKQECFIREVKMAERWVKCLLDVYREVNELDSGAKKGVFESLSLTASHYGIEIIGRPGQKVSNLDKRKFQTFGYVVEAADTNWLISEPCIMLEVDDEVVMLHRGLACPW
jgi:hypothetical protein